MSESDNSPDLWQGLRSEAKEILETRDYAQQNLGQRLATVGVEVGDLIEAQSDLAASWIPGVRILPRRVFQQPHRGYFGEFAREGESVLGEVGMWPSQWATATMTSGTAKGFHIHPPYIPEGEDPAAWFQKLFVENPTDHSLRPYDREQWDAMFFVQGRLEILLVDERVGMERRKMRILIDGDNLPGRNNAGVLIPAGVAHALRGSDSSDLIMVYGTSTKFTPEFEGRIESGVEAAPLPADWDAYFLGKV